MEKVGVLATGRSKRSSKKGASSRGAGARTDQDDPAQSQGGGGGGEACVLMRKKDGALSCHVGVCACSHACALARQCSHACHIIDQVVDEGDLAGRILGLSVWFGNPQTSGRVL